MVNLGPLDPNQATRELLAKAAELLPDWDYDYDGERDLGYLIGPREMVLRLDRKEGMKDSLIIEGTYPDGPDGEARTPIDWGVVTDKREIPRRLIILKTKHPEGVAGALSRFIPEYEHVYNQCLAERRLLESEGADTDETKKAILDLIGNRFIAVRNLAVRPNYAIEFAGPAAHFRSGEIHRSYEGEFQIDLFDCHPGFVEQLLTFLNTLEAS
jgi:hypothetical protein